MASVTSISLLCSVKGNGGGRLNWYNALVAFPDGDTECSFGVILAAIPGSTGTFIGMVDRGGAAFSEDGVATDGCGPYLEGAAGGGLGAIKFVNLVDGLRGGNAIEAAPAAHFTLFIEQ